MTQIPDKEPTLREILDLIQKQAQEQAKFNFMFETYQKAGDRVANLAFRVVTASAAVVVLAPAVKVLAQLFAQTMLN